MRNIILSNYNYVYGEEQQNKSKLNKILHNEGDGNLEKFITKHKDLFVLAVCEKFGYSMRIIHDIESNNIIHAYATKQFLGDTYYYDHTGMVEFESFEKYIKRGVHKENCKVLKVAWLDEYKKSHPFCQDKTKGLDFINRKIQIMKDYIEHTNRIVEPYQYESLRIIKRAGWRNLQTSYGQHGEIIIKGVQNYLGDEYVVKAEVYKDVYYTMMTYYEVYKNGEVIRTTSLRKYWELEEEMSSWLSINNQEPYTFGITSEQESINRLFG